VLDRVGSECPDAFRVCVARELTSKVSEAMESLSSRDQEFIEIYYLDGLTPEEAAQRLGVCVSTVYSKKHKIRARMESVLGDQLAA
jgi:RNA polymerase sigma-70 factor, ECF subfamily